MRAAIYFGKHDLRVLDLADPTPEPDEAIVAVRYCGFCGSDLHVFHTNIGQPGMTLGHEWSGEVLAVG